MKKFVSVILALMVFLVFAVPVFADYSSDAWYQVDSIKIGGFKAGGGTTRGGGVGRREYKVPADKVVTSPGYEFPGIPFVGSDGQVGYVQKLVAVKNIEGDYVSASNPGTYAFSSSTTVKIYPGAKYVFTAPCDGTVSFRYPGYDFGYSFYNSNGFYGSFKFGSYTPLSAFLTAGQSFEVSYTGSSYDMRAISYDCPDFPCTFEPLVKFVEPVENPTIPGDTVYRDTINNFYYSYTGGDCTVYYPDASGNPGTSITYNAGDNCYYITVYQSTIEPSPEPSFVPGGGSTRGGGVGRRPSDLADWTESWYCLNDHLYRAYYYQM